jgi:phenylalanyl-tRNA synthetase beta chain
MKISLKWISDYIDLSNIEVEDLVDNLTMVGLEVEEVINMEEVKNVIVAKVVKKEKHPQADKLSLCIVSDGQEEFQVICGAPNVKENQFVPFAKIGAVLKDGFKIKKAKLRGVESFGMICSAEELGLEESSDGIMVLPENLELGSDINKILGLGDTIIDISITPNRADCLSIIGVAREISAIYNRPLKTKEFKVTESNDDAKNYSDVKVLNEDACPVYLGRIIKDIQIKDSPLWMQNRLRAVGVRPINNIVDVTNYVLFEYGQPLHTFDLNMIKGHIIVRNAKKGESILTLDGKERKLEEDMLVIADEEKALAVAGVMGGEYSGINDNTKDVFLECAYFKPESIRMTARRLGLHSDSSYRFERGIDFENTFKMINYAANLIVEVAGGKICKNILSNDYKARNPVIVTANYEKINNLLGTSITKNEIVKILENLDFKVKDLGNNFEAKVPSYRVDISRWQDLSEEVARIYGYNNVPVTIPYIPADSKPVSGLQKEIRKIKYDMKSLSFFESVNYSFLKGSFLNLFDDENNFVTLKNPISEDLNTLRTYVFPGLLNNISTNFKQGYKSLRFYEIASTFINYEGNLPIQKTNFAFATTGNFKDLSWAVNNETDNFYYIKGIVDYFCKEYKLDVDFDRSERHFLHPGKSAEIFVNGKSYGFFGELHPDILEEIDVLQRIYICEIFLEDLVNEILTSIKKFTPFSKYPFVYKDLSIIISNETRTLDLLKQIKSSDVLIDDVVLYDVYKGKGVDDNFVSLTFRIFYSDINKTLTDEETNKSLNKIIDMLKDKFSAKLR